MTNSRFDMYRFIHKAIRSLMFETASRVATTDFAEPAEAQAAGDAIARMTNILRAHADHEDRFVMPLVHAASAAVYRALNEDHDRVEALHRGLDLRVAELPGQKGPERVAVVRDLTTGLHRLIAEHLHHMEREERDANAALWARFSDGELVAVHHQILAAAEPAMRDTMMGYMLPALSASERAAVTAMAHAA
jgi:hypothetical protein